MLKHMLMLRLRPWLVLMLRLMLRLRLVHLQPAGSQQQPVAASSRKQQEAVVWAGKEPGTSLTTEW